MVDGVVADVLAVHQSGTTTISTSTGSPSCRTSLADLLMPARPRPPAASSPRPPRAPQARTPGRRYGGRWPPRAGSRTVVVAAGFQPETTSPRSIVTTATGLISTSALEVLLLSTSRRSRSLGEQPLRLLEEPRVLERDAHVRGQRREQPLIVRAIRVLVARPDGDDADRPVACRDGHTQVRLGPSDLEGRADRRRLVGTPQPDGLPGCHDPRVRTSSRTLPSSSGSRVPGRASRGT